MNTCAPARVRVADARRRAASVEVEAGEIARIGGVAKAEVDAVGAVVDRGLQRRQVAGRADRAPCGGAADRDVATPRVSGAAPGRDHVDQRRTHIAPTRERRWRRHLRARYHEIAPEDRHPGEDLDEQPVVEAVLSRRAGRRRCTGCAPARAVREVLHRRRRAGDELLQRPDEHRQLERLAVDLAEHPAAARRRSSPASGGRSPRRSASRRSRCRGPARRSSAGRRRGTPSRGVDSLPPAELAHRRRRVERQVEAHSNTQLSQ